MELRINGQNYTVDVEDNMPLLWVLRDELNLTGTKYGCGVSACGACSVHIDGKVERTCTLPVSQVVGKEIKTIEAIAANGILSNVQKAWLDEQVPQCGYCQSGMIMAVESLLNENPDPNDTEINEAITNICRCGTYSRVRKAIKRAVQMNEPTASIE